MGASVVPMVVPIVSVEVFVVPKVWCLWCQRCLWYLWCLSVVVYGAYSVYDAYGHNEIVPYFLEYTAPSNRTLLKAYSDRNTTRPRLQCAPFNY